MEGHKKYNGTFRQNTNAVSHKQAHIKHAFIEIDDTDSDKICLLVLATKTVLLTVPETCQHWVAASPVSLISLVVPCFPIVSQCQ